MNDWKVKKIKDLGEIISGGTPSTKITEYWNGNISWITPKDLSNYNSRYISKGDRSITKKGLNNSSAKMMPKNSVLFSSRAPIGYVAVAKNELCTNQGFKSVSVNDENYHLFIYYLLTHNKNKIENIAG